VSFLWTPTLERTLGEAASEEALSSVLHSLPETKIVLFGRDHRSRVQAALSVEDSMSNVPESNDPQEAKRIAEFMLDFPPGLAKTLGVSNRELYYRIRYAELCKTEEAAAALGRRLQSWSAIVLFIKSLDDNDN
jgi:hypothetical protein